MRQHRGVMSPSGSSCGAGRGRWLRSRAIAIAITLAGAAGTVGCGTSGAVTPVTSASSTASSFGVAMRAEMSAPEDPRPYLDALDGAVAHPKDPAALAVVLASLEALVSRAPGAPGTIVTPVAWRSRDGFQLVAVRLRAAWDALEGSDAELAPHMRAQIAKALHSMALFTGEAKGAEVWGARRGCLNVATVVGPLDTAPLTALEEPTAVKALEPLAGSYPGPSRLAPAVVTPIAANACKLDAASTSRSAGLRELVFDVENPRAQKLSIALSSTSAAKVEVAGVRVLERRYEAGGSETTTLALVNVSEGTARIVIRLADKGDANDVELTVVDDDGLPLSVRAPRPGDSAKAKVTQPVPVSLASGPVATDADLAAVAAASLALGEARSAERLLEKSLLEKHDGRDPIVQLLFVRAMEMAGDMADQKRTERTRSAIEEIRKALPEAWEAKLGAAELVQRRKGMGEGTFEALAELGIATPDDDMSKLGSMELAYVVRLGQQSNMVDMAERAYQALAKKTPGSPLLAQLDVWVHPRTGRDWVKVACEGGLGREDVTCANALGGVGQRREALAELARLRKLRGAPLGFLSTELGFRIQLGDDKGALATYGAMQVGERSLVQLLPVLARMPDRTAARAMLEREAPVTRDGTYALSKAGAAFNEPSPDAKRFEDQGRALVEADRKAPSMPGAATAVLKHVEHYGIDESGLVHVLVYDLRRVSGTTDVERGIFVESPMIEGRGVTLPLRRRVHKKDGRVLEPDQAQSAMQGGSDLSQLEQGDYVEHVLEGYYLPTESGALTIDTPDLLPERTSVANAEVVVRMPEWLDVSWWSHPILGAGKTEKRGGYKFVSYALSNQAPRRIEDGLPWLERGVRLSFGTHTWHEVGRAVGESIRGMEDSDPFMSRFAAEAAKSAGGEAPKDQTTLLTTVVSHVGRVIKISGGGGELGDFGSYYGGGAQGQTARAMIEEGTGSRAWVTYRTLRELGVDAEIVVAETEPFSTAPSFPPHPGRFRKPLVVAHLAQGDAWVDADVEGPPLPPGRVSPELRGRSAILGDGTIVPVPVQESDPVDEVVANLEIDDHGTAKGKVTLVLRGQQAQSLSESFFYVVGDDRKEMLRGVVQGWVPWASVDDVTLTSREGAWEVALSADVTIPGFGSLEGKDGKSWVLPGYGPTRGGTLAARFASRAARQSAMTIDEPFQYRVKRVIKLPAGASIVKLPGELDKKSAALSAHRKVSVEGLTVTDEIALTLPTGTVGADAYRAFLDQVQAIDAGFMAGIRVKVK
jgi:hypothetical protein